jgi:putative hydrolase of the HAD superfamily
MSRAARSARAIEAVIWDIGGIIHPTPFEVLPEIERERGLPDGTYPRGPFDPAGDPDYEALERGEIREPEYWRRQQVRLADQGVTLDIHRTVNWDGRDRPEVVGTIRRLGRVYRQAVLTNDAQDWLGAGWRDRWWLRHEFEAMVDAAEEGIRKPAPEIYLRVADALGVSPAACLFIDDLPVNVAGATAVGMEGFHFDVRHLHASVRRLLGRLLPDDVDDADDS